MPLYPARAQAFFNVKDFGARGNGIADDTVAIQNAINQAALAVQAGTVYFPAGSYLISASLIVDSIRIALVADAERDGASIGIAAGQDPTWALIIGNSANAANCMVDGLSFIGPNSTARTGGGILVRGGGCQIRRTKVALFGGTGIKVDSVSGTNFEIFFADVNLVENGMNTGTPGDNLVITSSIGDSEYHRVIVQGDSGKSTTRHGINNSGGFQKFVDCHAYFCNQNGMADVGTYTQVIGGEWETNGNRGIGAFNINFEAIGASFHDNGNVGLDLSSTNHRVVGCQFLSNTNADINVGATGVVADCTCSGSFTALQIQSGVANNNVHDCLFSASTANVLLTAGTKANIHDNQFVDATGNLVEQTGANNNDIHDNYLNGGTITLVGAATKLRNNQGYNPRGHAVSQPAVPASTVAQTNTTGCDCMVVVTGGTVTAIAIGGTATGLTSGAFRVPVGQTITLTYSVAPTWSWFGD